MGKTETRSEISATKLVKIKSNPRQFYCSVHDNDNDNDNTFIEHKYRLQIRIYIYDLLPIKCYVLYLCMETNNGSD